MEERQAFNLVSPKFRQNKGSMRLGPWKCCVCSRVVEDCPQSDSFKKYFACSIGNHFAILNSSKLPWGLVGVVGYGTIFCTDVLVPEWNC